VPAPIKSSIRVLNFAWIGAIGFVVDAGTLQILYSSHTLSPLYARAISFPLAVTATWFLNARCTFGDRLDSRLKLRYGLYILGQSLGALINLGVFALLVLIVPLLSSYPIVPLALGSGCAMVFNYAWANVLVFPTSVER